MVKRVLMATAALVLIIVVAMVVLARAAFGSDAGRAQITEQLSQALGQTVRAGSISTSLLGTVTVSDIAVGDGSIHIDAVRINSGVGALVSRRLDHAAVSVAGLHAALPLQTTLSIGNGIGPLAMSRLASLSISDLQLSTRGRHVRVTAALRPHDERALTVSHAALDGDDMHAELAGEISDTTIWKGQLSVRGDSLDGDVLRSLAWDLLEQPEPGTSSAPQTAATGNGPLALNVEVGRLTLGPVAATAVKGTGAVGPGAVILDPVSFGAFGGQYQGQIALRFEGGVPSVRWDGALSNISVAGLTSASSGAPAITGVLSGDVDLTGTGADFSRALTSVRGSARITLTDGRIANLGIARSISAASSPNPQQAAQQSSGPGDTPFKTVTTALSVSGGSASLLDLRLHSGELTLLGGGGVKLDGSAVTVFADVQLSEALSKQVAAGRGRRLESAATLAVPVTIRGSTSHYQVSVELQEMTTAPLTTDGR
jgi:hypothetical protein